MKSDEMRKQGGSAFPRLTNEAWDQYTGMSLRDWFAGQAMVGLGSWMPRGFDNLNSFDAKIARARWAYSQADALLEAREEVL